MDVGRGRVSKDSTDEEEAYLPGLNHGAECFPLFSEPSGESTEAVEQAEASGHDRLYLANDAGKDFVWGNGIGV